MKDDAPERIWLDWPAANKGDPVYDEPPERDTQPGQTEYVRADLPPTLSDALALPEIAALVEAATLVNQSYWYSSDGAVQGMYVLERALSALRAARDEDTPHDYP